MIRVEAVAYATPDLPGHGTWFDRDEPLDSATRVALVAKLREAGVYWFATKNGRTVAPDELRIDIREYTS